MTIAAQRTTLLLILKPYMPCSAMKLVLDLGPCRGWSANRLVFIPIFHQPEHGEWHRQQIHHEVPSDPNSHRELFAAETDRTEQRAQANGIANEEGRRGEHDVLVEMEGFDVKAPAHPPIPGQIVKQTQGSEKDAIADEVQHFQTEHPASRRIRRRSYHQADFVNQVTDPSRDPRCVTATDLGHIAEQPYDPLEGVLEKVA